MKTTLRLLFALLLGAFALARPALAADAGVTVRGLLIVASKQPGEADKHLAPFEAKLREYLPGVFQSFRLVGEGTASVPASGKATLTLAQGHRLEITGEGGAKFAIHWMRGNAQLMEQTNPLSRGTTLVLGGPDAEGGDKYAIILIPN